MGNSTHTLLLKPKIYIYIVYIYIQGDCIMLSKTRMFNGKKYRLAEQTFLKRDAQKIASRARKDGIRARIVETSSGYAVYFK